MKREAELKAAFGRELQRKLPHFVMLHYLSAGAPDREIIGNNVTTRWEMKHCTPDFDCPGNQVLVCMRLAAQGHCRFVLWKEDKEEQRTLIVHPQHIFDKTNIPEAQCVGFNHEWLVDYIKRIHGA